MSSLPLPPPQPGILDIAPYQGGESHAVDHPRLGRPIRLAANEGALGPSPMAVAAYRALAGGLHRYPDGGSGDLRRAIGERFGLEAERIVCGAGSDEIIALLIQAYAGPGDEVLHSRHGFLMYAISARAAGATPVAAPETNLTADIDALITRLGERTRLVFLANPNNPTGSYLGRAALERLIAALPPQAMLVLDGAYAEYMDGVADYTDGADLVTGTGRVVMTRTFSKLFALPALRLGWAYCPSAVADVLNRVRGPFNVSAAAQAAGVAALADRDFQAKSVAHNTEWRAWTARALAELGLTVHPSHGNFLLVDFAGLAGKTATQAAQALKDTGILVRPMAGYGLPDCLRIGIGDADEMPLVRDALGAYLTRS